jgi:hypothetical protein
MWRLSKYHSDNLGLAFTDDGLLLGRIPLVERRDGRFVVRERSEIARLGSPTPANSELAKFGSARRDDRRGRADQIRAGWRRRERLESRPASAHRHTAEFRLVRDEGGHREEPGQDESSSSQSRLRIAANEDGSMRTDATSSADDQQTLQPGNPIDEPANLTDRPDWTNFWSDIWPSFKDWLEEPVPEYDLESGQVAGTPESHHDSIGHQYDS